MPSFDASAVKVTVEIDTPKNQSYIFEPLGLGHLRSRLLKHRYANKVTTHAAYTQLPDDIPGMLLSVDVPARTVRCVDALTLKQNESFWERLKAHVIKYRGFLNCGTDLAKPVVHEKRDDTTIKTWLYWFRRMVDEGLARVVTASGSLPTMEEIESMPGKVRNNQLNTDTPRPMHREDFNDWGDWVGPKAGEMTQRNFQKEAVGAGATQSSGGNQHRGNQSGGKQ